MSYHHPKRCRLILAVTHLHEVKVHQDRGDGTALCAVGTQHPDSSGWEQLGPGDVDCELCAARLEEIRASGKPKRVARRDPLIAESLDERIARMRRARDERS